jgi:hypothetical protein
VGLLKRREEQWAAASDLVQDLSSLILEARQAAATAVNAGLTLLYWRIGRRVLSDLLGQQRADYGREIILVVASSLEVDFGSTFGEKNLRHMLKFADVFPDHEIVYALCRQLSWSRWN